MDCGIFDSQRNDTGLYSRGCDSDVWNRSLEIVNSVVINNSKHNDAKISISTRHPLIACQQLVNSGNGLEPDTFCQTWSLNYYYYLLNSLNHAEVIALYNNRFNAAGVCRLNYIKQFAGSLLSDEDIAAVHCEELTMDSSAQ